jgi:hypothetical protein
LKIDVGGDGGVIGSGGGGTCGCDGVMLGVVVVLVDAILVVVMVVVADLGVR